MNIENDLELKVALSNSLTMYLTAN